MTTSNDRLLADNHIAQFTQNHTIHLMALPPIISFLEQVRSYDNLEDMASGLKSALYDLTCLDAVLHDNQDNLWSAKEYHDTITAHH